LSNTLEFKQALIVPDAGMLEENMLNMIRAHNHPIADPSSFAQFMVYKKASDQGYKVMLDGQGADEILAGYSKYNHWALQALVRKGKFLQAINWYGALKMNEQAITGGLMNFLWAWFPELVTQQITYNYNNTIANSTLLNTDFVHSNFDPTSTHKPTIKGLNDILYYDTTTLSLQDLLRYADVNSMANGVEVRLPFLDHRLVELIFSLELPFKINKGFNKYLLRKTMDQKLPDAITWRKKKVGFEVPREQLLNNAFFKELLNDSLHKLRTKQIIKEDFLTTDPTISWRLAIAGQLI
jgi:asparagine synthase (glutamine-hydrolysing)